MWFTGAHWPRFRVHPNYRRNRDGAPVIFCEDECGLKTWVITVERWLDERRTGGIVTCESPGTVLRRLSLDTRGLYAAGC